ncbi:polyadenylate-binding protein 4-like [Cylas formicarius]|uniref:polyadenylate-binding protein 4-like n=1 Tax=Cylas formicarius TaxID=197179 RepID=UPI002958CB3D|nr:polyadenylate-binding protein 4-like [Cylas formicarius]
MSNVPPQGVMFPGGSLYVGDLHPDVTEGMLYEKFCAVGTVLSLRVCRDSRTRQSLGYAYVNFNSSQDAERALDTMNFDLVKGRPIRIMWCQRDPSLRKSGVGNIFIKNLDKSIDNKAMYDTFSAFGNILSCKVQLDDDGYSKGYGFVHFESQDVANKAISKVNGMLLNGKIVYVSNFVPKSERVKQLGDRANQFTNIYVKNFGAGITDDRFRDMFAKYGPISSIVLAKHHDGTPKGFGFVAYREAAAAARAVEAANGTDYDGKQLYVGRAQKKAERVSLLRKKFDQIRFERFDKLQGANVYVKNLDDTFTDAKLHQVFAGFGTITSAKVMTENGRSKGFGFVCFAAPEEADKAIDELHGKIVGTKPLYVAHAQRREERKAILNTQYSLRAAAALRQSSITFPTTTPPFVFSSVQAAAAPPPPPRYYNQLGAPINHLRPNPRWPPVARPNGTYGLPVAPPAYRSATRAVQAGPAAAARNSAAHPRPITGQQGAPPPSRPNSKYTSSSGGNDGSGAGAGNGGDNGAPPPPQDPQKQMIGEQLYSSIRKFNPELAGKITGMLLEIDNTELVDMIKDQESLRAKVDEAVAVLQAHSAKGVAVRD